MKHIIIRNLGPITEADVYLNRLNLIVGPQSSGKSCLLKVACFCSWAEKRIQLSQKFWTFDQDDFFINRLVEFHKLNGYVRPDTYIEYETDYVRFSYDMSSSKFSFDWKKERWEYRQPKVSYIPAERNLVAVIPNWFEVNFIDDNIRNFMSDWEQARRFVTRNLPVMNLGVSYHYDKLTGGDKVILNSGALIDLTNTSSGLQSLIPLFVYLNYLYVERFNDVKKESVVRQRENEALLMTISQCDRINDKQRVYNQMTQACYNEIFLEEPELNLFPPTQTMLIDRLLSYMEKEENGCLSMATHSPYIVTSLLEREKWTECLSLFFTVSEADGSYKVRTATDEDVQQIYDYGVDVFFNIDAFSDRIDG